MIHPQAVVDPTAQIGTGVRIGPFCVIEADVSIGDDCTLESGVVIKSGTTLGRHNRVGEGTVLGGGPQHARPPEELGRLEIGSHNTIRENVTIHRSLYADQSTRVGDQNLFMVNAHIAHDCAVGNRTILANNVMLGGHVIVEDQAFLSGGVAVHQFCRIGRLAMTGGQAHVVKDVAPFVTVDGLTSYVVGLNSIGLRRAGVTPEQMRELKQAYRLIFRRDLTWAERLERLAADYQEDPASHFHTFLSQTKRGIVQARRGPTTLKLRPVQDEIESFETVRLRKKAG